MTGVKRTRRGVVVSFDEVEASLLRHLVGEVRDLLADGEPLPPPAGGTAAVPTDAELSALTGLGTDLGTDLGDEADPLAPSDPALARLLPDAYLDDDQAAGEFRRLTESSLRRDKVSSAERLLAALPADGAGEVRLDPETTESWLATINDVRLALGTRLEVTEEMAEPDPEDPDAPAYVVYLWLTELQGVLIEVADG
ncbi:MAG TPA: DUF2017 domain-containing protein [Mycobacteriales bacterium]|nr:DUF2017 domain-containing protein [Mycobacteriales bacterium]